MIMSAIVGGLLIIALIAAFFAILAEGEVI